jgi:hypothetical protein
VAVARSVPGDKAVRKHNRIKTVHTIRKEKKIKDGGGSRFNHSETKK